MATIIGTTTPWALTTQDQDGNGRLYQPDWDTDAKTGVPRWTAANPAKEELAVFDETDFLHTAFGTGNREATFKVRYDGNKDNRGSAGANWFEQVHVIPRTIDLGNILTDTTVAFEVTNAFRYTAKTFTSFTLNAGSGITTSGLPSLPTSVFQLDTVGFDVIVSTDGDSTIDGTFDVVFGGSSISVPIVGSRIVMFPYQPEAPLKESLEFLTEILTAVDGTEQRISNRKGPRQTFSFRVFADNDRERQRISNLLFDWQGRVFGLPVWAESTTLTSDVAINDLTVNVASTANADYRVGELAIVLKDDDTFDALTIESTTATSVTFDSVVTQAYLSSDPEVLVMPLRSVFAESVVQRTKNKVNTESFDVTFVDITNDSDLADVTGWTSHPTDSKVILDGSVKGISLNVVRGQHRGQMRRRLSKVDSRTGRFTQSSPWTRGKDEEPLEIFVGTRALLWDVRQLLHSLRGQQVSFYLPTFFPDMTVNTAIVSGGSTMQIDNVGYAQFSGDRIPRNLIRLTTTAGVEYIATVSAAATIDDDNESMTVSVLLKDQVGAGPTWPDNIAVVDIKRVDFVQKVRMADDTVDITHEDATGNARISARIMTVFD